MENIEADKNYSRRVYSSSKLDNNELILTGVPPHCFVVDIIPDVYTCFVVILVHINCFLIPFILLTCGCIILFNLAIIITRVGPIVHSYIYYMIVHK